MKKLKILAVALMILTFKVSAESFVYITDQLDLPIRSDKAFGNNIIRLLPSGTELSLLQSTEDGLSLIHISEPTRPRLISYAVFCLKKNIKRTFNL